MSDQVGFWGNSIDKSFYLIDAVTYFEGMTENKQSNYQGIPHS